MALVVGAAAHASARPLGRDETGEARTSQFFIALAKEMEDDGVSGAAEFCAEVSRFFVQRMSLQMKTLREQCEMSTVLFLYLLAVTHIVINLRILDAA